MVRLIFLGLFCAVAQINVSYLDAEVYANSQNIKYFETSAKTNIGVEEMFTEITRQALEQKMAVPRGHGDGGASGVDLNTKNPKDKKKCC